jgi:hypothetical protein
MLDLPMLKLLARSGTFKRNLNLDLTATGPVLFAAVCLATGFTMLSAALFPAHRAKEADPLQVVRCD